MASAFSKSHPSPQPTIVANKSRKERRHGASTDDLPATGFVRLPKVLHVVPVSPSGWWAGIHAGRYPKGVKLSPRVTAWSVESIRALVETLNSGTESGHE